YRADDRYVYLTDGGHYENLGLVELLRRKCRLVLCFDAAGDSLETCGTFVEALMLASEELGASICIDLSDLAPQPAPSPDEPSPPFGVTVIFNERVVTIGKDADSPARG